MAGLYPFLQGAHYWLSRVGFAAAILMFIIGLVIGVIRKRDVTLWYRLTTYAITVLMLLEAAIGGLLYVGVGARPYEDVHLIYGLGAVLALPFFIFVERTAKKRPAMGSYIWGFAVLTGILIRAILTGAAG
jgi:hypothetical protein